MKKLLFYICLFLCFEGFAQDIPQDYNTISSTGIYSFYDMNKNLIPGPILSQNSCFDDVLNSLPHSWMKFETVEEGNIQFKIEAFQKSDDLDFVLYKQMNNQLVEVSCNSNGPELGALDARYDAYKTGVVEGSVNVNFNTVISTKANETYFILIINAASYQGYSFEYLGSANLKGKNLDVELISIYPIPSIDIVNLQFESNIQDDGIIRIIDDLGNILNVESVQMNKGENLISVDISNLTNGIYKINLKLKNINKSYNVIKQ